MEINGREYAFLLTAGAAMDIADMCPGKDLRNFAALLDGSACPTLEGRAAFICALSRGAEDARAFEEPGYKPQPLTPALLRIVDLGPRDDCPGKSKKKRHGSGKAQQLTKSWLIYYGHQLGMSRRETLTTTYGEMLDMIACMAISSGHAEPVNKHTISRLEDALEVT